MGMLRRKDDEKPERGVSLWLKKNKISFRRYRKLSAYLKGVLRNLVCISTRTTSPTQRKDLYKELCLPDIARTGIDPDDFVPPDERLKEFFSPVAPSERLSDLEKY